MSVPLDIIAIGPEGKLLQISDGQRFGHLEISSAAPVSAVRIERLQHPEVIAYLRRWLTQDGAWNGDQNPPRIDWATVIIEVLVTGETALPGLPIENPGCLPLVRQRRVEDGAGAGPNEKCEA